MLVLVFLGSCKVTVYPTDKKTGASSDGHVVVASVHFCLNTKCFLYLTLKLKETKEEQPCFDLSLKSIIPKHVSLKGEFKVWLSSPKLEQFSTVITGTYSSVDTSSTEMMSVDCN